MGAKCELCGKDMLESKGCAVSKINVAGKVYKRISVGGQGDFLEDGPMDARCGDCGALMGHYHHWGCDCERRPACGLQLIGCDCEVVYAQGNK